MGEGLLFSVGSARWFLSFCLFLLLFARQKKIYYMPETGSSTKTDVRGSHGRGRGRGLWHK